MPGIKDVSLLDENLARYADVFAQILIHRCRDTLLPELIEVFGKDRLPMFLDMFAGCTFKVPSRDIIVNAARDADMYECISRGVPHSIMENKYGISPTTVDAAVGRVRKIVESLK